MSTVRIQVRRGTASQWTSVNPILAAGEMGVESDTNLFKFGNGTSTWSALAYANNSDVAIAEISQDAINSALSLGAGLSKTYNDGANTISITVDSNVVALKSYVDSAVSGLANTLDTDYIPLSDRGAANGVAALNGSGKIPDSQIDESTWARKFEIDAAVAGITIKTAVQATSTQNFASVRVAGTSDQSGGTGIGEKLTASANGALVIDGVSLVAGDRVLLKDQTDAKQNGIYEVTNAGGSSAKAVLTRALDSDNSINGEVKEGDFVFTIGGTVNQRDGYVLLAGASRPGLIFQLGTDSIVFSQFTGAIPVQIADGLKKNGDVVLVDFDVVSSKTYVDTLGTSEAAARATLATSITNAVGRIDGHDTTISSLTTSVNSKNTEQDAAISSLNTTVSGHTTTLGTHTTQISTLTATNTSQDSAISGLGTRLTSAESNITTQGNLIQDTAASVTTTNTSIRADLAPKASPVFTGTVVLPSTTSIGNVSSTEIGYVDGVTSAIQTQLDAKLASNTAASTYATIASNDLKAPLANPTFTGTVAGITKSMVGLGNVDNTADSAKPISTATQTALDAKLSSATAGATYETISNVQLKAPLASPALTGVPTAPTATAGTSTTQVATTAFVGTAVSNLVASAPAALDTLNELATALGNDASFSTTITNALAAKAPLANPTFTGTTNVGAITAAGAITANATYGVIFSDGTQIKAGVPSITTIGSVRSSSETLTSGEQDKFIPVSGAVVITLPASGYVTGQSIDFYQSSGTGASFASTNGVVGTPGLKFRATNSVATAMKISGGWLVFGDLSA